MDSSIVYYILLIFLIWIFLGMPIAYSMIVAGIIFVVSMYKKIDNIIIPFQRLSTGVTFPLIAILLFVILGNLMSETKISHYLVGFLREVLKKVFSSGRTGIILVCSSLAIGTMTGSANAATSAIGAIMLPEMEKAKYDSAFSASLLAYSGILGSLIPPSITGLVYAIIAGLPVFRVWIAVCGVGILYALLLIIVNIIISKKRNYESTNIFRDNSEQNNRMFKNISKVLPAFIVPVSVLGSIYLGISTPTEAGSIGILISILLGVFYYKSITSLKQIMKVIFISSYQTATIMFLVCASYSISYVMTSTGVINYLINYVNTLGLSGYSILIVFEAILLFTGTFMDDLPVMILLAPIATMILVPMGIDPYHIATTFIFVSLVGAVTPPVGTVLYISSSLGNVSVGTMLKDLIIFFIPTLVLIIMITFIPFFSHYLVNLLF